MKRIELAQQIDTRPLFTEEQKAANKTKIPTLIEKSRILKRNLEASNKKRTKHNYKDLHLLLK